MLSPNDSPNCSPALPEEAPARFARFAWPVLSLLGVAALWANTPAPRRVLLLLAIVLALLQGWRQGSLLRRLGGWFLPFVAIVFLSALWSPLPAVTLVDALGEVLAPLMACLLAAALAAQPGAGRQLSWLLLALLGAALVGVLGGLHVHLGFWPDGPRSLLASYPGRGIASTAGVLLSLLGGGLLVIFHRTASPVKWLAIALLFPGILLGVLGYNRMFWFALLLGALPWLPKATQLTWKSFVILATGVLLLAAGILYSSHFARQPPATVAPPDAISLYARDARWVIWREWLTVASERPLLGYAYGSRIMPKVGAEKIHIPIEANALQHAHNVLLNIVIQTGLLGLAAFALMLVGLARLLGWGEGLSGEAANWRLLGTSLLLGALAKSMTDDFFWSPAGIVMYLLVGLAAGRQLAAKTA